MLACWSPSGNRIACGGLDGGIYFLDMNDNMRELDSIPRPECCDLKSEGIFPYLNV